MEKLKKLLNKAYSPGLKVNLLDEDSREMRTKFEDLIAEEYIPKEKIIEWANNLDRDGCDTISTEKLKAWLKQN